MKVKLNRKTDRSAIGRRSRRKGNSFMCQIANALKPLFPQARRGLQSRDGSEFADIEGTPWWIECKDQKRPSLFAAHRQSVEAQTTTTVGKDRKRVKREEPDDRPRLLILKQFGNGTPYWCCEQEQFLELLQAKADLEKLLELGYEVPR